MKTKSLDDRLPNPDREEEFRKRLRKSGLKLEIKQKRYEHILDKNAKRTEYHAVFPSGKAIAFCEFLPYNFETWAPGYFSSSYKKRIDNIYGGAAKMAAGMNLRCVEMEPSFHMDDLDVSEKDEPIIRKIYDKNKDCYMPG